MVDLLGPHVEWVPVCPEVEAGMGVPREAVHLARGDSGIRMVGNTSGTDHTDKLNAFATRRVEELAEAVIRGYFCKSGSQSCGLENVPINDVDG